jgi:hypothetical protein
MSHVSHSLWPQHGVHQRESSGFDDALYAWMQRAPWLALSALAHALVAAILMAIPWELLEREEPKTILVALADVPVESFEEPPREPELPLEPLEPQPEDPILVDDARTDDTTLGEPMDCAEPAVGAFFDEFPATDAGDLSALGIGGGWSGGGHLAGPRGRGKGLGRGSEDALRAGLAWLRDHQAPDGRWSSADFMHDNALGRSCDCDGAGSDVHDVGVTGLALLAFLGDGNTPRAGPYRENVARGVNWLREQQDRDSGRIGPRAGSAWIYDHAIAALALCEAWYFTRNPLLREPAQSAVDFVARARNPYSAWRYELPPDGESDTSVTGWMVLVLTSADEGGLTIDRSAYAAALAWLDEVTDHVTGRAGYTARGSLSARMPGINEHFPPERGEAMTAVALLSRFLLGQVPRALGGSDRIMDLHAAILLERLPAPAPDELGPDLYYWYYGSYAMHQMGGEQHWERWRRALDGVLPAAQRTDADAAGSWDPDGPWGCFGGRVYSTALALLTLEVPIRYARVVPAPGAPEPRRRRR